MTTQDIVSKPWNLRDIQRDDGIAYHESATELCGWRGRLLARLAGEQDVRWLVAGGPRDERAAESSRKQRSVTLHELSCLVPKKARLR